VLGADEKVVASFPVSIGGPRDPLPIGRMKIVNEVKNPSFTYDPALLKDAKPGTSKTEIAPGPNNPVGNVWLGLSKPHWGIHGTPKPERLGREETNGCVHLTNWDAQRLSTLAKAGFVVDVRE
jgi:lipoprotein-anchoring transpeptidase ErfK/SrfK